MDQSDSSIQSIYFAPRNRDNINYTVFHNGITGNNVEVANDGTLRILTSYVVLPQDAPPSNVLSEFFSSMTNTTGKLTNYITYTTIGTEMTDLSQVIIGITYTFRSGSRTFDPKPT